MARMGIIGLLMPALLSGATLPVARGAIVVASESGVDAYAEALEGLDAALGSGPMRVVDVRSGGAALAGALAAVDVQLVIAVGGPALAEVQLRKPAVPVVATMVLHGAPGQATAWVYLDVPLSAQLEGMRSLWPQRRRVGIIRNPAHAADSAETLESRARREGFTAQVVDCDGPARLLKALASLRNKVDFLLCYPDPDLYNSVTIKPLVLASIEGRLPLVGFSPAFVRAGAAAGIYADYREIGRMTAETALRLLRGENGSGEDSSRKIRMAVNQRVMRLLGVEFHTGDFPVEVFR